MEQFTRLETLLQSQSAKLDLLLQKSDGSQYGAGFTTQKSSESQVEQEVLAFDFTIPAQDHDQRGNLSVINPDLDADARAGSPKTPLPCYCGPSSSLFCLSIIGVSLKQTSGTTTREQPTCERGTVSILNGGIVVDQDELSEGDPLELSLNLLSNRTATSRLHESFYPLHELGVKLDEALRLVVTYDDQVGVMHPILNKDDLLRNTAEIYAIMSTRSLQTHSNASLDRRDVSIIKIVLAIALATDGLDNQERASRLFKSLQREVEGMIWTTATEVKDLHLLILVAIYHFVMGNWRFSWRLTNTLVRMALELGLNLQKVVLRTFEDPETRTNVCNTFWTIFVLDRQMSYALGLPKSLQDADVDNGLLLPFTEPYLTAMVEYCSLGSKICDSLSEVLSGQPRGTAEWQESYEYFRYRLNEWKKKNLGGDIQAPELLSSSNQTRDRHPRTVLYLRANQLLLLMLRPALCGPKTSNGETHQHWNMGVDIARDTIQVVADLESTTDLYRAHQTLYNYFLVTALGMLLLLQLSQDPQQSSIPSDIILGIAPIGLAATQDKAHESAIITALSLLKSTISHSTASKRLWLRAYSICVRLGVITADHAALSGDRISDSSWPDATDGGGAVDLPDVLCFPELGNGLEDFHLGWKGITPNVGWLLPEFQTM